MRNTGTIYSSTERSPTVLPEMAELLPPLTGEQLAALETDILKNGCYSPVIVNEDMVVIDGHNRQRLCEQHGLPYQMAVFSFEDMLEAKPWALDPQKGRRIWEPAQTFRQHCQKVLSLWTPAGSWRTLSAWGNAPWARSCRSMNTPPPL